MNERSSKISLCITTRNRVKQTIESFIQVYDSPFIDEIIVVDDASDLANFVWLCDYREEYFKDKMVIHHNDECIGMQANKARALSLAKNNWCILLDSDNRIDYSYIDAIYDLEHWYPDTIYCPSFAMPQFDYTAFEGMCFGRDTIKPHLSNPTFKKLLNTANYFVNKYQYAKVYKYDPTIKAADTIFHAHNHLEAGGILYVVPGMRYAHLVHEGSGWQQDLTENRKKARQIQKMIMEL